MSPLQAVVVALWFGTGSPCLLTLELPLDRGLQMALYKEHECPLIWSWQCDRAGPGLLSLQNTPHTDIAVFSVPSSPCRSMTLRRESREGPSLEVLLRENAGFGGFCSLLQRDGPLLPSEG